MENKKLVKVECVNWTILGGRVLLGWGWTEVPEESGIKRIEIRQDEESPTSWSCWQIMEGQGQCDNWENSAGFARGTLAQILASETLSAAELAETVDDLRSAPYRAEYEIEKAEAEIINLKRSLEKAEAKIISLKRSR